MGRGSASRKGLKLHSIAEHRDADKFHATSGVRKEVPSK